MPMIMNNWRQYFKNFISEMSSLLKSQNTHAVHRQMHVPCDKLHGQAQLLRQHIIHDIV